jgi:hypothetical protein
VCVCVCVCVCVRVCVADHIGYLFDGEYSHINDHAHYYLGSGRRDTTITITFTRPRDLTRIKLAPATRSSTGSPDFSVQVLDSDAVVPAMIQVGPARVSNPTVAVGFMYLLRHIIILIGTLD